MDKLNQRFAAVVSRKLGVPVVWTRDIYNRDGSSTPVFGIPANQKRRALALGLTVDVTCEHCGGYAPIGQSCGCFDNGGQ